ncbi:MAG: beta-propeller domain-containing protein [Peptococcaceae bacterium]|nr:beta-propeller domain-containing protein [Peptococcaceae bacterium]
MRNFFIFIILLALAVIFLPWLQPKVSATPGHQAAFVVGRENYVNDGLVRVMDVAPFTLNNRAYVPVRFLAGALGVPDGSVVWDEYGGAVTIVLDGTTVRLAVGSALLQVGGQERAMDVAPVLKDGRVFVPARWVAEALGYEVGWDEAARAVLVGPPGNLPEPPAGLSGLPVVGTYENLKKLLAGLPDQGEMRVMMTDLLSGAKAAQESLPGGTAAPAGTGASDYSRTNVQVEGVDEADIVKVDGSYIYQVNGERVVILKAYPAGDMKVAGVIDFAEKSFYPQEMYVDGKFLVVIGHTQGFWEPPVVRPMAGSDVKRMPGIIPPYYQNRLKAVVYDVSDRSSPRQLRELELSGSYVSSRKVGSALYLVASRPVYHYPENGDPRPFYRDTAAGDEFTAVDYPEIRYFPECVAPNYLIVAGLSLERPDEKASIATYLGAGENIYASPQNLYVAVTNYQSLVKKDRPAQAPVFWPAYRDNSRIYRFAMDGGRLSYAASGEVPGTVLNQFSMDEHNGYFRIATTRGDAWRTGEDTSRNNVYILDEKLNIAGRLEDIAPGEKIYSVRFMGDRGYMVTFKTVDPFFVIDLKDPGQPRVLGALKIPGYSNYLHPYDENHIIGFGKDTIELGQKSGEGGGRGSMAFYTGMKMAVFDVSDVNNPVEMFRERIGDRGTDSELLHNHKALLFSREKKLLAFPVTVMEVEDGNVVKPGEAFPEYGRFKFQGAYVYSLDLAGGFSLRGKITHLSDEDYLKAGNYWYYSDKNVERIVYIGDTLYTLSRKFVKANDLSSLAEIKALEIK